jgi:hypothetical protein
MNSANLFRIILNSLIKSACDTREGGAYNNMGAQHSRAPEDKLLTISSWPCDRGRRLPANYTNRLFRNNHLQSMGRILMI